MNCAALINTQNAHCASVAVGVRLSGLVVSSQHVRPRLLSLVFFFFQFLMLSSIFRFFFFFYIFYIYEVRKKYF